MKKNIFYFIIFSILFHFSACRDVIKSEIVECNEEGKYYGAIHLSERADSFWTYKPNQTRVYIINGQEIEVTENWNGLYWEEFVKTPLDILCSWHNTEPVMDYADLEYRRVNYTAATNPGVRIDIELEVRPIYRNDSIFFIDRMTVITGLYQRFTIDNRNVSDNSPSFIADTTISGKHFQNVYYTQNEPRSLFYTKEQGIVAFLDFHKNLYVLDRVE
jgi:hypothetical protein